MRPLQIAQRKYLYCLLCLLFGAVFTNVQADSLVYRASTNKSFQDVMEDLSFSIGSHNFRQTSRNAIGGAIRERGNEDFEEATVVHFCNLELAHKLLEISKDYLIHMPCRVVVWEGDNRVYLETKLVPDLEKADEQELVNQINQVLVKILDQTVERWTSGREGVE